MTTYELSGGDDGAYGPVFGPLHAIEVKLVVSGSQEGLLLRLAAPIRYRNDAIEFFVVSPRYTNDTIAKLWREECTVGIGRVLPGKELDVERNGVTTANVEYWSIGTCKPTTVD